MGGRDESKINVTIVRRRPYLFSSAASGPLRIYLHYCCFVLNIDIVLFNNESQGLTKENVGLTMANSGTNNRKKWD